MLRVPDASIVAVKFLSLLLCSVLATAFASVAQAEDWTTTDGVSYQDVRVIRVEDDAITILYRNGGALIPLFKLPPALQRKFDYDPVKAKLAAEARANADQQNARAMQKEIEQAAALKRQQAIKDAQARGQAPVVKSP
jgi:hypothetical protein